jgi:hypothetical protein
VNVSVTLKADVGVVVVGVLVVELLLQAAPLARMTASKNGANERRTRRRIWTPQLHVKSSALRDWNGLL